MDTIKLRRSDIGACPQFIMMPGHYRLDGSCRCDDETHCEMLEWEYTWNAGTGRWQ